MKKIKKVKLYSDGGANPNPGIGGYGIILDYEGIRKKFCQGFRRTTNNRMELLGVIIGLEKIKEPVIVDVYTDSKYLVNGIKKGWAVSWKKNGWKRKGGPLLNIDLWDRLLNAIDRHVKVDFHWVKGHNGHLENEICDELTREARKRELLDDIDKSEEVKKLANKIENPSF